MMMRGSGLKGSAVTAQYEQGCIHCNYAVASLVAGS